MYTMASKIYDAEEGKSGPSNKMKEAKDFCWTAVNFKVRKSGKAILNNCWGSVSSGTLCAVMGPSGKCTKFLGLYDPKSYTGLFRVWKNITSECSRWAVNLV
jgi:ABC-type bacteriocin/lantibiotic exporter with double-glycine peptidase domain